MKTGIYHHDEEPIMADEEYRRLRREATRACVAEEMEAWQLACAERVNAMTQLAIDPTDRRWGLGLANPRTRYIM